MSSNSEQARPGYGTALRSAIRFGLSIGCVVALLTTATIAVWEWVDNPGGIFHGPDGTNWRFVLETAVSWLIPTFMLATLTGVVGHLLVSAGRRLGADS